MRGTCRRPMKSSEDLSRKHTAFQAGLLTTEVTRMRQHLFTTDRRHARRKKYGLSRSGRVRCVVSGNDQIAASACSYSLSLFSFLFLLMKPNPDRAHAGRAPGGLHAHRQLRFRPVRHTAERCGLRPDPGRSGPQPDIGKAVPRPCKRTKEMPCRRASPFPHCLFLPRDNFTRNCHTAESLY